jgi:protein phosphatase
MVVIESAGLSDVGRKRKINEDALLREDELRLYLVADGMGGHKGGEVASRLVVQIVGETLRRLAVGKRLASGDLIRQIGASIQTANRVIHRYSKENLDLQGMGSTLSAVMFSGRTMIAANVGDSPIYLIRGDLVEVLSTAHTYLAEYANAALAESTPLEAEKYRHVITRSIGSREEVTPDIHEIPCAAGDILVICSDGLSDHVDPGEIVQVVHSGGPGLACRLLVDMANERGGSDNITVVVVKVLGVLSEEAEEGAGGGSDAVGLETERAAAVGGGAASPGGDGAPEALQPQPEPEPEPGAAAAAAAPAPPATRGSAVPIYVEYDSEDLSNKTLALEISLRGVLVETFDPLAAGQEIQLTLSDAAVRRTVMVAAQVAARSGRRVAFRFNPLSPELQTQILALKGGER